MIDPKVAYWINVVLGVLTAISIGVISFTDFVPAEVSHKIASAAAIAVIVLNMVLHGYSAGNVGPGMPPVLKPPAVTDWKPPGVPNPRG